VEDRIGMQFLSHPSEEEWELYAMARAAPDREAKLEEHLLGCPECQEVLERVDDFVQMMKGAAPQILKIAPSSDRLPWFTSPVRPRIAGVAIAVVFALVCVAVAATWRTERPSGAIAYVTLAALRDESTATAPAARPLEIGLSLPDVGSQSYSEEVITAQGQVAWTGTPKAEAGKLRAILPKGLEHGSYWVRLYGADRSLILEAGLKVQ